MKLTHVIISGAALLSCIAEADVVVTKNGSSINGTIEGIDGGKITMVTDFAGEIVIDQSQVESISTDEPVYMTLENGTTVLGPVSGAAGDLTVASDTGTVSTNVASVTESWLPGADSPTQVRQQKALADLDRKWAYEAAFDLTGKSGNKTSTGLATALLATLEGKHDKLELSGSILYTETDDEKSADQAFGGIDYSNKFRPHVNWYVRTAFGYDAIKDIEQYFNVSGGFGYTFFDTETRYLNTRAGIGYLYESYDDIVISEDPLVTELRPADSSASLDFGLRHKEIFKWGVLNNRLVYTPTLDDFGNFRLVQDSNIELPLKSQDWSVRIGLMNRYDSEADESDKEELDTTYYVRMVLKWL
ncbi:DUF481 domain-containing protein [Pelagicoccus sp. SDUM812003]|uniref:DUF481 domain-containing protein n=1 Tax=Pelagicoccus sp. SDUM812003 TaxID=3041267 RepID=UPI00280E5FEA|nr:DUF481 domain-containing protein [Pelagicoccus sp. SDUM812003]MDQ8203445.1 DUF481 domain-containing protein [Pelagicoccus sp. SDUM812003]